MEISKTHDDIALVLSHVYMRADWKMMSSYKRPRDTVFMDRVKRARNAPDAVQAVQRLCRSLDVSASVVPLEELETIAHDELAMTVWREHHDLLAMKASKKARDAWAEKKTDSTDERQKTLMEA